MKYARIIGFAIIGILIFAALYTWRNAGNNGNGESVTSLVANIDGATDAPVQIVEYGDFGCTTCRGWHNAGIKDALQEKYGNQISFEFRHFPVITSQSPKAAEAGQCAAEQDKFWEYHDYIYEETAQGALSNADLKQYASAVGINPPQFAECLDSGKYSSAVQASLDEARELGARGTPTFFVNGTQTAFRLDDLSAQIEAELAN